MADDTPDLERGRPTVTRGTEFNLRTSVYVNDLGEELVVLPTGRTLVDGQEFMVPGYALRFSNVGLSPDADYWTLECEDIDTGRMVGWPIDRANEIEKIAGPGRQLRRRGDGSLVPSKQERERRIVGVLDALVQVLAEEGQWKLTRYSALADRLGVLEKDLRNALEGPVRNDRRIAIEGGGQPDGDGPAYRTFMLAGAVEL